jgi:hypothetical protein
MQRTIFFILGLTALFVFAGTCFSQNQTGSADLQVLTFEGQVVEVDWVAAKLAVRSEQNESIQEKTFIVPRDLLITKGVESVGLQDINVSDNVSVQYSADSDGSFKAISISVIQ